MKEFYLTLFFLMWILSLSAQVVENPERVINDLMESLSENEVDLNMQSQIFDELLQLYERPINLNRAGIEDLEKMIFLTDIQIRAIVDYVQKMGPLESKYQLQAVGGLSPTDIDRLMMFVKIEPIEAKSVYKNRLDGQVLLRDQFNLEKAKGYQPDSAATRYLGNRHHFYSKFQLQYGRNFYGGFVMDKDPGEETLPIDFTSGYLMYQGDKLVKTVIVGDYHANFGQGLALWSGTSMGKTSEPLSIRKRGEGFKKYSSANENAFFRGVATTLGYKNAELSLFASVKSRDADMGYNADSTQLIVNSMPTTGYHRTQSERDKKNALEQSAVGANLNYRFKNLSVLVGGFIQKYDADSIAVKAMYQYSAHEKTESSQYWLAYNYGVGKMLVFGELAMGDNGKPAVINGLQFKPANNVSLALLHRYFSPYYFSPWVNALSENSFPSGESGFYLGMSIFPISKVNITGYVDVFKTDWLKYSIDKPAHGYDISFRVDYNFSRNFKVYVRYREKDKFKNQNLGKLPDYPIAAINTKKIRLHTDVEANQNWALQMRIEKSFYKEENMDNTDGVLAFAGIKFAASNGRLACWLRYLIFDTDDYDTRLYAYENDLLYNFYTPAFQGEGSRAYFMFSYQVMSKMKFWFKAGRTSYSDRDELSSGLETIDGNARTDIRMQLQFKF